MSLSGWHVQLDVVRELLGRFEKIAHEVVVDPQKHRLVLCEHLGQELVVESAAIPAPFRTVVLEHEYPVKVCPGSSVSTALVAARDGLTDRP